MVEFARRQVGRTGLEVTELGLGCATLGGSRIDVARQAAEDIVAAAWDAGVRYVDTAPFYGVGQAERCVGDALRERPRDEWVLSTKVGRLLRPNPTGVHADGRKHPLPFDPVYDYSYDGIMRSFEDSLQRLGLARIDILYVHDIGTYQHGPEAHPALMRTLRDSGYRALESLRGGGAVTRDRHRRQRARGAARSDGMGRSGMPSCWPAATRCWSRRRSTISCRNASPPAPRSWSAGRSIPASWPAATPGTTTRRRPKSSSGSRRSPRCATPTGCRCRPPRCNSRWPTRRSPRSFPGRATPTSSAPISASCGIRSRRRLWADLKQAGLLHPAAPVPV